MAEVGRGDDVLSAALAHDPDVALLDIEMPGGAGITVRNYLSMAVRKLGAGIGARLSRSRGTRAGSDERAVAARRAGYRAGMFGRERVLPGVLTAVAAVLAGVLVGSGLAGRSGGVIGAVAVQAVMPPGTAHASVTDRADPSSAPGGPAGGRKAIAVRAAPQRPHRPGAGPSRRAATGVRRPAAGAARAPVGQAAADPPPPAASRPVHRRHHHPYAGRGHHHPGRRRGAHRHRRHGHRGHAHHAHVHRGHGHGRDGHRGHIHHAHAHRRHVHRAHPHHGRHHARKKG